MDSNDDDIRQALSPTSPQVAIQDNPMAFLEKFGSNDSTRKSAGMVDNRDARRIEIEKLFEEHQKKNVRRYPMAISKYIQTMFNNQITGLILVLKIVREDYHTYNLSDGTNAEITDDWVRNTDNNGLVAYVEFWKIEENKQKFNL